MPPATKLPLRQLGKNGPLVPRMGMGLMHFAKFYGLPNPENERLAFLDKAYEMGQTYWDTADMYGDSEDVIGKWIAANPSKREDIFLATKFGERGHVNGRNRIDSSPEYCREAIDKSLKRLNTPFVDLYYVHRMDKITPIEKTMAAMVELKTAGKIRHIGLSECSSDTLRRAHAVHPTTAIQMEYNPVALDIEQPKHRLLETARELGVAVVTYSPLAHGILTGGIKQRSDVQGEGDTRWVLPMLSEENLPHNVKVLDELKALADSKGITLTQLTLAWILAQGDDIFPIPGTTKVQRLQENLDSLKVTLSPEEEKKIREIAGKMKGARFHDGGLEYSFADTPPLDS